MFEGYIFGAVNPFVSFGDNEGDGLADVSGLDIQVK
jgi:hypothetical protein